MALINPCSIAANPSNTGAECSNNLKATAMLIMCPKTASWSDSDLTSFSSFIDTKIHAEAGSRFWPLFGNNAPIRQITEANENDVIETLEDGSVQFIRYGMYNRTFLTTEGGLAFARHMMSMNQNFGFIEVDIRGQVAFMNNGVGANPYAPFPVNLAYAPAPDIANLKTSYKNKFMLSFTPNNYVRKGIIFATDSTEDVLGLRGLYDTKVSAGTVGTQSTTHAFVKVATIDGGTDLIALYGVTLAVAGNFILKAANGSVITPSAVAIANGEINFTGTFTTGTSITVALAAPSVLKAAGIEGYEGTVVATVAIP